MKDFVYLSPESIESLAYPKSVMLFDSKYLLAEKFAKKSKLKSNKKHRNFNKIHDVFYFEKFLLFLN